MIDRDNLLKRLTRSLESAQGYTDWKAQIVLSSEEIYLLRELVTAMTVMPNIIPPAWRIRTPTPEEKEVVDRAINDFRLHFYEMGYLPVKPPKKPTRAQKREMDKALDALISVRKRA